MLSVIIPFSYRKGDKQCLKRLHNALACFQGKQHLEVVLFDTSPARYCQRVKTIASMLGSKYFHEEQSGVFSPGETRNKAVSKAQGRYVFFCDADLLCPDKLVNELLRQVTVLEGIGRQAFAMFPCFYLSQKATLDVFSGQLPDYSQYWQSYFQGLLDHVDGIAVASSCLLVEREWFLRISGFKPDFSGHGYEDFELIHRLAAYYPLGMLPDDYAVDDKHQFPADYVGFRRFYSYYALPHLFSGHFLLHQWHKRPLANKYHRLRQGNEELFANILSSKSLPICDGIQPFGTKRKLPGYREWIMTLMQDNGYDLQQYPGLFHWQEGVSRPSGNWQRKLRKLVLKPRQFFRDMV